MLSERNNCVSQHASSLEFRLFLGHQEKELGGCLSDFPPWVLLGKVVHQESRSIMITVNDLSWLPQRTGWTLAAKFSCYILPRLNYLLARKGQVFSLPRWFLPSRNLDQKVNHQSTGWTKIWTHILEYEASSKQTSHQFTFSLTSLI